MLASPQDLRDWSTLVDEWIIVCPSQKRYHTFLWIFPSLLVMLSKNFLPPQPRDLVWWNGLLYISNGSESLSYEQDHPTPLLGKPTRVSTKHRSRKALELIHPNDSPRSIMCNCTLSYFPQFFSSSFKQKYPSSDIESKRLSCARFLDERRKGGLVWVRQRVNCMLGWVRNE